MNKVFLFLILWGMSFTVAAQQFILTKKSKVVVRYDPGDDIRFELKGDGQVYHAAILQVRPFDFITLQRDTIKYQDIYRLWFKNPKLKRLIITSAIGSVSLLALHFALKEPFGEKNPQAVTGLAYAATVPVLPILLAVATNRRQITIRGYKRLRFINYDSPLYR